MNVSPDQVRAATRSAAAVITPDKVPPLRLDEPPPADARARAPEPGRPGSRRWPPPRRSSSSPGRSVTAGSLLAKSGQPTPAQRFR